MRNNHPFCVDTLKHDMYYKCVHIALHTLRFGIYCLFALTHPHLRLGVNYIKWLLIIGYGKCRTIACGNIIDLPVYLFRLSFLFYFGQKVHNDIGTAHATDKTRIEIWIFYLNIFFKYLYKAYVGFCVSPHFWIPYINSRTIHCYSITFNQMNHILFFFPNWIEIYGVHFERPRKCINISWTGTHWIDSQEIKITISTNVRFNSEKDRKNKREYKPLWNSIVFISLIWSKRWRNQRWK